MACFTVLSISAVVFLPNSQELSPLHLYFIWILEFSGTLLPKCDGLIPKPGPLNSSNLKNFSVLSWTLYPHVYKQGIKFGASTETISKYTGYITVTLIAKRHFPLTFWGDENTLKYYCEDD